MYTAAELKRQLEDMGIRSNGTLFVHSSMKAIGEVEGGADTVLDVLCDVMQTGLLVLPTHTWRQMSERYHVFDVVREPSCVGILSELFRRREGVVRSYHPTHSVAAFGRDAAAFTAGEERTCTPCPRDGCYGRLYDRGATVLFIGCTLKCNTFLHGVEEWCSTPNRLAKTPQIFTVIAPNGQKYTVRQYRHHTEPPEIDVSEHYDKMEPAFRAGGAVRYGRFGDARCIAADAVKMADITAPYLRANPRLFDDDTPLAMGE